ncbi:MAG: hypothetical protein ACE5HI_02585 [bacterium]
MRTDMWNFFVVVLLAGLVFLISCGKKEEYRTLTKEDGLDCGARIASMEFSFGGEPTGELVSFECLDKNGNTVQLELASKKMIDGKIETKDFGTILLKSARGASSTYYMTDRQIKKIKEFLGFSQPNERG